MDEDEDGNGPGGRQSDVAVALRRPKPGSADPSSAGAIDPAGRTLGRSLRMFGWTWTVAIAVALPVAVADPMLVGLPRWETWAVGLFALVLSGTVAIAPWERLLGVWRVRLVLEGYAIVVVALGIALSLTSRWSPIFVVLLLSAGVIAGLFGRRPVVLLTLVAPVLAATGVWVREPSVNILELFLLHAAVIAVVLVLEASGSDYRRVLDDLDRERLAEVSHSRHLARLAGAAPGLAEGSVGHALDAIAQLAPVLDWDAATVMLVGEDGWPSLEAHHGERHPLGDRQESVQRLLRACLVDGRTVLVDEPRPGAEPAVGHEVLAAAPISVHGRRRGVVVVGRAGAPAVSEADLESLELLAELAGSALEAIGRREELQDDLDQMSRVNRLRQDFLGTVSHEIRTPVAVVLGMAETLDVHWDELPPERRRSMVQRLHVNAGALERVIQSMLDHTRLEAGVVQPDPRPFSLVEVVDEVVRRLSWLMTDHPIDRRVDGARPEARALADPALVERVIENLVTNACRHTPPGTRVTIDLRDDGDWAIVEVTDDGPGIPAEDLARLGERFYRGQARARGLGLGLAFCREVLELHGTSLVIASEPGRGATFRFVLPHASIADIG